MPVANASRKLAEISDLTDLLRFDHEIVVSQTVELSELWRSHLCNLVMDLLRLACKRREQHRDRIDARCSWFNIFRIVVDHDRERQLLAGRSGEIATQARSGTQRTGLSSQVILRRC